MDKEKSNVRPIIDQGKENGKQWFGAFISIEPGKTGELSFEFYLSSQIVNLIKENKYNLSVQKQIGTIDNKLTLNLDFGKKINKAEPSEEEKYFGDNNYNYSGDLRLDRVFSVNLQ